jgi:hypothetical protein
MNKELLADREKFKKSFLAVHDRQSSAKRNLEQNATSSSSSGKKSKPDKDKVLSHSAKSKLDLAQLKQMGGNLGKFGCLTKIVRHMRHRHMEGLHLKIYLMY